tara:strand:- start:30 stop:494 length:465 start_codon:yes stop_codon:yes gene_type:complete
MAKKAKLWGKPGPWTQYPARMLQVRARAMALRDQFADVLSGIHIGEEVRDIPNGNGNGNGKKSKTVALPAAEVIAAPEPEPAAPVQATDEVPQAQEPVKEEPQGGEPGDIHELIAECKGAGVNVDELDGLPFDSFSEDDLERIAGDLRTKLAAV